MTIELRSPGDGFGSKTCKNNGQHKVGVCNCDSIEGPDVWPGRLCETPHSALTRRPSEGPPSSFSSVRWADSIYITTVILPTLVHTKDDYNKRKVAQQRSITHQCLDLRQGRPLSCTRIEMREQWREITRASNVLPRSRRARGIQSQNRARKQPRTPQLLFSYHHIYTICVNTRSHPYLSIYYSLNHKNESN